MGIQYFYNFFLTGFDDTEPESDILSAVRKSYFSSFDKIRDKITYDSEGVSMLYDYCIEKDKPLRWSVKNPHGGVVQEVIPADSGRYYLCFYRGDMLVKRLLFSKLHTLLKAEYMNESGVVCRSLEPRKVQGGLCLLYTDHDLEQPVVLTEMPTVSDECVRSRVLREFKDYTAAASTNEGVIRYLSDEQLRHFRDFVEEAEAAAAAEEESFVDGITPLLEKINAKDFNMKRNLSASLDISMAKLFGASEQEAAEPQTEMPIEEASETLEPVNVEEEAKAPEKDAASPDKLIMADGAVYSYYGELDDNGNRSGYGRTVTELGRTAYEGCYRGDKRSGKGSYYYKDGSLCYSGDWSENVRHGVGAGVSARDGSIHVGKWVNNKPEGNGVRLSADGEIKFVCKELSDGCTVLMYYRDDDVVLISKYDANGTKISERTVSLVDF